MIFCLAASAAAQDSPKPAAPAAATSAGLAESQPTKAPDFPYEELLDPRTPETQRASLFAKLEKQAQAGDAKALYVVGSLYHIGRSLPASPVERDLAKARLYLSNAATHGEVYAMAKMAEIEAAADHPQDALTWTQIYAHYVLLKSAEERPSEGYLGELVERASRGVRQAQMQDVVDHLNLFITSYDKAVREGSSALQERESDMEFVNNPSRSKPFYSRDYMPPAGFAEYLVGFDAKGIAREVLLIDATPDLKIDPVLRGVVGSYQVRPASDNRKEQLRYAFISGVFDDAKFKLAPRNAKPST